MLRIHQDLHFCIRTYYLIFLEEYNGKNTAELRTCCLAKQPFTREPMICCGDFAVQMWEVTRLVSTLSAYRIQPRMTGITDTEVACEHGKVMVVIAKLLEMKKFSQQLEHSCFENGVHACWNPPPQELQETSKLC